MMIATRPKYIDCGERDVQECGFITKRRFARLDHEEAKRDVRRSRRCSRRLRQRKTLLRLRRTIFSTAYNPRWVLMTSRLVKLPIGTRSVQEISTRNKECSCQWSVLAFVFPVPSHRCALCAVRRSPERSCIGSWPIFGVSFEIYCGCS